MNGTKYIGLDVHQATISVAVMDPTDRLLMECVLETKPSTILEFIQGMRGRLYVTFEEGTWAAWLHDLLEQHVTKVLVIWAKPVATIVTKNKAATTFFMITLLCRTYSR
jgi:hypothetical protein